MQQSSVLLLASTSVLLLAGGYAGTCQPFNHTAGIGRCHPHASLSLEQNSPTARVFCACRRYCSIAQKRAAGDDPGSVEHAVLAVGTALSHVIAESGTTFAQLQPAVQALLQAAADLLVRLAPDASAAAVLITVQAVPLLSCESYSALLQRQLSGNAQHCGRLCCAAQRAFMLICFQAACCELCHCKSEWCALARNDCGIYTPFAAAGQPSDAQAEAFAATWAAAVSAATDPVLASTPAFGLQRPNVAGLLWALPAVWQQLQSSRRLQAFVLAFLMPVIDAAAAMLTQQWPSSQQGTATAAAQLLDTVCRLIAESSRSGLQVLSHTETQRPVMLRLLAVLQERPQPPKLQHLQAALRETVWAESAQGDGSVLEAAERLAAWSQLPNIDKTELHWGVVAGTAAAFTAAEGAPQASHRRELLLLYWPTALLSAAGTAPSSGAAVAVVEAMAADTLALGGGDLAQQLLAQQLPTPVLAALIKAAAAAESVLPQLLAHAVQTQQL